MCVCRQQTVLPSVFLSECLKLFSLPACLQTCYGVSLRYIVELFIRELNRDRSTFLCENMPEISKQSESVEGLCAQRKQLHNLLFAKSCSFLQRFCSAFRLAFVHRHRLMEMTTFACSSRQLTEDLSMFSEVGRKFFSRALWGSLQGIVALMERAHSILMQIPGRSDVMVSQKCKETLYMNTSVYKGMF